MRTALTVLITLLAVYAAGCPKDRPPQISLICTLDGHGGADCADPFGKEVYKAPSEMTNYWATTQADAVNLISWCYGGLPKPQAERLVQEFVASRHP